MSKGSDKRRIRVRRARKAEQVVAVQKVVEVYNSLTQIGPSPEEAEHVLERRCQTIVVISTETKMTVVESLRRITELDAKRIETLERLLSNHVAAYNELEVNLTVAAGMEQVRLKQQLDQMRPKLCQIWWELSDLFTHLVPVKPSCQFVANLCHSLRDTLSGQKALA